MAKRKGLAYYLEGIQNGNALVLSRAITLLESSLDSDRDLAQELVGSVKENNDSIVIAVSGIPGVGKSSLIESLGMKLCQKAKVAVLTIDPSSEISGGSILGDKTRMDNLSKHPNAYIRPSPNLLQSGGVGPQSRETIHLCKATGFDYIIIETVGVGQSETRAKSMTDLFLYVTIPSTGDELQGMKKGIMEIVDLIFVNKADLFENTRVVEKKRDLLNALHYGRATYTNWAVPCIIGSAHTKSGIDQLIEKITAFKNALVSTGAWQENRDAQMNMWLKEQMEKSLLDKFWKTFDEDFTLCQVNDPKSVYERSTQLLNKFTNSAIRD